MPKRCLFILILLLLAAGCGHVPTTAAPAQEPTTAVDNSGWTVLPAADTPIPYPLPTREIRTAPPLPSATPLLAVPVLGAEWAPEAERQTYISTTVVLAKVGDGPGEIGYWQAPEAGRIWADRFTVDVHGSIYVLDKVNHRVARFGPQGEFVANTPYDQRWDIVDLAADGSGGVFLGVRGDGARLLDIHGNLLQDYARPSWINPVWAMWVDEQGTLWFVGTGTYPHAPSINGQPFPLVSAPIGSAVEILSEDRQKTMAKPGFMLFSGQVIVGMELYLYDAQGRSIYQVNPQQTVIGVDQWGDFYVSESNQADDRVVTLVKRVDPTGETTSLFGPLEPEGARSVFDYILTDRQGTVYVLSWDWDAKDAYRVIRWEAK